MAGKICFAVFTPTLSHTHSVPRVARSGARVFGSPRISSATSSFYGTNWRTTRRVPFGSRGFYSSAPCMRLKSGIVGLPNVGKSTLFNALVENSAAEAANYPFCTIEPNTGIALVPDKRLSVLGEINESVKVVPASLEFVDIAGLVAGASKGEGLGNQFLHNIRECDAIVHVVRCFDDENIVHVAGSVDPIRDIETINIELTLADMAQLERRGSRAKSRVRDPNVNPHEAGAIAKLVDALNEGTPARSVPLSEDERASVSPLGLLTMKPVIFAANVADEDLANGNEWVAAVRKYAYDNGAGAIIVSAQVEAELISLDPSERREFLESLGVTEDESGLRALVRASYNLLGLRTYFTSGPTETRAWTIPQGFLAPQAAGVIHSDFERGFIRAETIAYEQLVDVGSEKAAKERGLLRSEGKEYEVQEGDVMLFRFNV